MRLTDGQTLIGKTALHTMQRGKKPQCLLKYAVEHTTFNSQNKILF